MTSVLMLTGLLLSSVPGSEHEDALRLRVEGAAAEEKTSSGSFVSRIEQSRIQQLAVLRRRSQVLLDDRPTLARYLSAGLLMLLGAPVGVFGTILIAGSTPCPSFLCGLLSIGVAGLVVGATLTIVGIMLVVTGVIKRSAIDTELNSIDDEIDELQRRQQQAADAPSAERQLPTAGGMVLAHF